MCIRDSIMPKALREPFFDKVELNKYFCIFFKEKFYKKGVDIFVEPKWDVYKRQAGMPTNLFSSASTAIIGNPYAPEQSWHTANCLSVTG